MNTVAAAKVCKRCHGTGEHSYHSIHGRVCFACGGKNTTGAVSRFALVYAPPGCFDAQGFGDAYGARASASLIRDGIYPDGSYSHIKLFPTKRHALAAGPNTVGIHFAIVEVRVGQR